MKIGLFPGQGIPARSVLAALPQGDPLVTHASEILCYDLRRRVESVARRQRSVLPTSLAQPAIFVAGLISFRSLIDAGFGALAGHSLGEYTALAAGGAMSFEHALCVVEVRAKEMHLIASRAHGGMVAIIDLSLDDCEDIAGVSECIVANDNAPGQVVIAGPDEALARASELARAHGGRAVRLEVTGPFHTPAIAGAAPALRDALDHVAIRMPDVPVISNVSASAYRAPGEIRKLLVEQLTSRVRFRGSLERLVERGATEFVDLGPGRVVAGLAARAFEPTAVGA